MRIFKSHPLLKLVNSYLIDSLIDFTTYLILIKIYRYVNI